MAAYFESGFSVREPMWHGMGMVADTYPADWDQAREWAGLQWEPMKVPMFRQELSFDDQGQPCTSYVEVPSHQLVVRDDTDAPLGVVTRNLELVTHRQMGEIVEALVGSGALYETAGAVRGGAQVYATVKAGDAFQLGGTDDTSTMPYMVLTNAHDGSGAVRASLVAVRVVCWNTYRLAEAEGIRSGRTWVFRHNAGVNDRIEEAKQAMAGVADELVELRRVMERLQAIEVDERQVRQFVSQFIPRPPAGVSSERVQANVDRDQAAFLALYDHSPTTDGHRGTALGVIDAAVEYLDHLRKYNSKDTYLGRTLLRSEPMKAGAYSMLADVLGMTKEQLLVG